MCLYHCVLLSLPHSAMSWFEIVVFPWHIHTFVVNFKYMTNQEIEWLLKYLHQSNFLKKRIDK